MNINILFLQLWAEHVLRQNLQKSIDKKDRHIELYPFQEKILKDWSKSKRNVVVNSRQTGMSSLIVAHASFQALNEPETTSMILYPRQEQCGDMMKILRVCIGRDMYRHSFGDRIYLKNGSTIMVRQATENSICGHSIDNLYLMDFDFFSNRDELFRAIMPTISAKQSSKIVITSTPKDKDGVLKLEDTPGWSANRVIWNDIPGRDTDWLFDRAHYLDKETFKREFECRID